MTVPFRRPPPTCLLVMSVLPYSYGASPLNYDISCISGQRSSDKRASGACLCNVGELHRPAFTCSWDDEVGQLAQRLRQKVKAAARVGFDHLLLERALPDAEKLLERWDSFMPAEKDMSDIIKGKRLGVGATVFTRLLWQSLPREPPAGASSYCLYAHATAAFVVARLRPLVHATDSVFSGTSRRLHPTSRGPLFLRVWRRERGALPRHVVRESYMLLHRALLNFGFNRKLDQARLTGWPVGSAEIVELAETFRTVCLVPSGGCTLLRWESAIRFRLRRMANFIAGAIVWNPADEVMGATPVMPTLFAAMALPPVSVTPAMAPQPKMLWAFFAGTHAAVIKELLNSWNAAINIEGSPIREVLIHGIGHGERDVYQGDSPTSTFLPQRFAALPRTCENLLRELAYVIIHHDYLSPASVNLMVRTIMEPWLRELTSTEVAVFVCSIPAVLCAAFASMPLPVIHYLPTTLACQVAQENVGPFLKLYAKMAEDPKNHFIANSGAYGAMHDAMIGRRLPVIPVLALYINNSYAGWRSSQVLVFNRDNTLMHEAICSLVPENSLLRFVSHWHTDRHYSTFARHRAVIFVPGAWTQMSFWEFYAMGLPSFIPAYPGLYLWPPLPASLARGAVVTGPEHARPWREGGQSLGTFAPWTGKHVLRYKTIISQSIYEVEVTLTFNGTSQAVVKLQTSEEDFEGLASLTPLDDGMDMFGSTHALTPAPDGWGGIGSPYFINGNCLRLSISHGFLSGFVGPKHGGLYDDCAKVEGDHANWHSWYQVRGDWEFMDDSDLRADGAMTGGFGETFWYFGQTRLSHRRRQTQPASRWDPFTISRHSSLSRLSRDVDMFRLPHVGQFTSVADLLDQLTTMRPIPTSKAMREFTRIRRTAGLAAWRSVLFAVVAHPSQDSLLDRKL
eukprot:TRINITY_DN9850_c0_g2_i1.p1 TRINITY_DN9850_c0_g2~~TRINITY_DN9850_c0_g2_i1.p1  ORF type:complete len:907 (+),score=82.14 TRINITY_DN9850_c0_g2_i1:84-2804(+)